MLARRHLRLAAAAVTINVASFLVQAVATRAMQFAASLFGSGLA